MKIGYSFWGFIGPGITDTPDGGRSHRRPFVDGIRSAGHELVFLQPDRDLAEAGDPVATRYLFDAGLPDLDVLFLEWRWPIPDRNTTPCGTPGHTCDLHRQSDLVDHYTHGLGLPTIIWDKDRQLPANSPLRHHRGVVVCEAAVAPTPGAATLLFPADDAVLDAADPAELAARKRPYPLCYVGNQYDRDEAFEEFFVPAAARLPHRVAGKWPNTSRWPQVCFLGRVPFAEVSQIYHESLATVLLLPDRYAVTGQMTQRIFEAVLAGCLPLAPATIAHATEFVPESLIVSSGADVIAKAHALFSLAGGPVHRELIGECLAKLELFRLSRQLRTLDRLLADLAGSSRDQVGACS
ncbi:hypothetical protein GCM10010404_81380 [Nonomuraea africana]|uniref:Spore protein YkvP/CgeB glycosyl transferase-like domain-containing protein n=1 Tax=Nonomuraea africana TaxID=46171 RepID=A0ABR9KWR5_9ACTN|nr:hypothetical protein [Nonomuraea africana]MBE1566484.1 hypothetical protein [Nonomuraea africana]